MSFSVEESRKKKGTGDNLETEVKSLFVSTPTTVQEFVLGKDSRVGKSPG